MISWFELVCQLTKNFVLDNTSLNDVEETRLVAKLESFHGLAQSLDGTDHSLPNDTAWIESDVSFSSYILQPHLHGLHRKGTVRCLLGKRLPELEVRVSQHATSCFWVLPAPQKRFDDWRLEVLLRIDASDDDWASRVPVLSFTVHDLSDSWKRKPSASWARTAQKTNVTEWLS